MYNVLLCFTSNCFRQNIKFCILIYYKNSIKNLILRVKLIFTMYFSF